MELSSKETRKRLKNITEVTLLKWVDKGILHPIKRPFGSRYLYYFQSEEIDEIATHIRKEAGKSLLPPEVIARLKAKKRPTQPKGSKASRA